MSQVRNDWDEVPEVDEGDLTAQLPRPEVADAPEDDAPESSAGALAPDENADG